MSHPSPKFSQRINCRRSQTLLIRFLLQLLDLLNRRVFNFPFLSAGLFLIFREDLEGGGGEGVYAKSTVAGRGGVEEGEDCEFADARLGISLGLVVLGLRLNGDILSHRDNANLSFPVTN